MLRELERFRQASADGGVTFLSGPLGVVANGEARASDVPSRSGLEKSARRFLRGRLAELAADTSAQEPGLAFDAPLAVDDGVQALHARQTWDGIEVMDSRLTFVFAGRTMVAFAGRVRPPQPVSSVTTLTAAEAVAALETDAAPGLPSERRLRAADGRLVVEDAAGREHLELTRVVDPESAENVWLATRGTDRWTIGGREARVRVRGSAPKAISYASTTIRHGDAPAGTTDWMRSLSSLDPIDGTMTVQREDLAPSLCRYSLRYDEFRSNGISPEVLDYSPGAWLSYRPAGPCSGMLLGADFRRGPESPSAYRQQHYYWWLRKAGDYVRGRVFNTYAPLSDWDVGLAVNEPTGSCGQRSSACFEANPWSRWIHLTVNAAGEHPSIQTLFHEYGHYFVWAYGGLTGNCGNGDEGRSLNETIGDSIALLVGKHLFNPRYGDLGLAFLGDGDEFPLRFTGGTAGCYLSGDEHFMGRPFVQAIWQVLFDANCHDTACAANLTGIRGDIGWPSESSARDHMLRALAYALKLLPANATHEQVVAFMYMYLLSNTDVTLAQNVLRVFDAHGL